MSRLQPRFAQLAESSRKALVTYVMAGDPTPSVTVPLLHDLVRAGANVLELGMPFSDPMADGPVIAAAAERALAGGSSTHTVFELVREFRQTDCETPVVLMGYLNPVEIMGYEAFARRAHEAGVDGILLVDLPPEESGNWSEVLAGFDMDPIFLVAPTTTDQRMGHIAQAARGFVYYVSLKGVTGSAALNTDEAASRIRLLKSRLSIPVGVGFGIHDRTTAQALGAVADAVIVGSALVRPFGEQSAELAHQAAVAKVQELRQALDELA